jgi:hypothetical protein
MPTSWSVSRIPTGKPTGWWFGTFCYFFPFHIWHVILPIDELHHIFQACCGTTNQFFFFGGHVNIMGLTAHSRITSKKHPMDYSQIQTFA